MPEGWLDRAKKAWEYYLQEPIVSNVINSWIVFAIGDQIQVTCQSEDVENEAKELFAKLNVNSFIKDMILQLLVKGDCIGYFNRTADGRNVEKVTCINPVSVKLKFDNGVLISATQSKEKAHDLFSDDEIILALDQLIHLKWNSPEFSQKGNSMVLPAFESLELLKDFRNAERAIARRWTTPLRFIKVGGYFGKKFIVPDKRMIDDIRQELNRMDEKEGLVVPFYVNAETYGTEGKVLETEKKVKEIKEDILVALGMARSVVAGDGPNYATANISMQKMIIQLKEIKQSARQMLDWLFNEWKELRGYKGEEITYHFNDLDLHNEADIKKLLLQMYDRGLISKKTLQTKMGLDPKTEEAGKEDEEIVLDTNWSVQDIVQLVSLDILTPTQARSMLGIKETDDVEPESNTVDAIYRRHKHVNTSRSN